jgi:hypothetical protein
VTPAASASALVTVDGIPVRVVFSAATSERRRRSLLATQHEQEAHRAHARETCAALSGSRDPLLAKTRRSS